MILFQCLVFFFYPLLLDIFGNDALGAMLADRVNKVALPPELPAPKLLFHFGTPLEDFPGYDALHHRDNLRHTVRRNALDQKMNVVPVRADLQKTDLISFFDLGAGLRHGPVDRIGYHDPAIFCTTYQMVKKVTNIVTLMYKFAIL